MKKTMKLIGIIAITAVILFSFASCGEESPSSSLAVSGSAPNNEQLYEYDHDSDAYIESTKNGKIYVKYYSAEEYEIGTVVNGKLSFKLQEAPPVEALFLLEDDVAGLTISDKNAKMGYVNLYFKDGSESYELYYDDNTQNIDTEIWYLDRNVSVTGSHNSDGYDEYTTYINFNFKKGFNTVYFKRTEDSLTVTTTKPAGANLKWVLYSGI